MPARALSTVRPYAARAIWVVPVILAGLAASFALWDPLDIDERAEIHRLTAQSAASIKADLEADLQSLLLAHVRLAATWGAEEPAQPLSGLEWLLNCRLFLQHYPSDLALVWLDDHHEIEWTADRETLLGGRKPDPVISQLGASVMEAAKARRSGDAIMLPPFRLPDGRTAIYLLVPVVRRAVPFGHLVALFDVKSALNAMLSDHHNLGFSIAVVTGVEEVYRSPGSPQFPENQWIHEAQVPLAGILWRVRVWPNPEMVSQLRSSLPELAAVLGGLLGSTLLVTIHFWRAAQSRSKELREARDELESRVRERTKALQRANDDLEAQVADRRRAEESLRHLSGRLLQLQDEERRRIARELHDSTTQLLGGLAINVDQAQRLARTVDHALLVGFLSEARALLDQVSAEVKTLSYLLHPPMLDELGLGFVLPWFVEGYRKHSGIAVHVDIQPDIGRLATDVETTLFRIAQEALTNVRRHSGSSTATIMLRRDSDTATLEVTDRGRGVPPQVLTPPPHAISTLGIGIMGMRERVRQLGGRLDIISSDAGTTVRVVLPLTPRPAGAD